MRKIFGLLVVMVLGISISGCGAVQDAIDAWDTGNLNEDLSSTEKQEAAEAFSKFTYITLLSGPIYTVNPVVVKSEMGTKSNHGMDTGTWSCTPADPSGNFSCTANADQSGDDGLSGTCSVSGNVTEVATETTYDITVNCTDFEYLYNDDYYKINGTYTDLVVSDDQPSHWATSFHAVTTSDIKMEVQGGIFQFDTGFTRDMTTDVSISGDISDPVNPLVTNANSSYSVNGIINNGSYSTSWISSTTTTCALTDPSDPTTLECTTETH